MMTRKNLNWLVYVCVFSILACLLVIGGPQSGQAAMPSGSVSAPPAAPATTDFNSLVASLAKEDISGDAFWRSETTCFCGASSC